MSKNDSQPLVSIGVPVYNGEEFLVECLQSILEQTYSNWVCNINNNCSTDKSLEIAESFVKKDSRFSVKTNDEFVELVPNWNLAYMNSNLEAKYFKIVQADDWIYPEYLEKMVELFEENDDIGMTSSFRFDANMVIPRNYFDLLASRIIEGKELLIAHLERRIDILGNVTTIMFSNKHLRKIKRYPKIFDEASYHIDTELALEIMDMSYIGFVQQILSYNRLHEKSGTSTVVYQRGTLFQHYNKILGEYIEYSPTIKRMYRENRLDFAYALFKMKLTNNKVGLEWHRSYPSKPFSTEEYVSAILSRNAISQLFVKIVRKVLKKLKG